MFYRLLILTAALLSLSSLPAQWTPGDVYREYIWTTPEDGEAFLRVGGRYGYAVQPGKLPDSLQRDDHILFPHDIDLAGATHATLTFERVQSHEDSKGLQVSVNGHDPIDVPQPAAIPEPATEYMYHTDVTIALPLVQWKSGKGNAIRLTLDTAQRWGWPQNIFYALILRVHYNKDAGPEIDYPYDEVPQSSYLRLTGLREGDKAADYILVGRDTDWSGRGVQQRKHWQTFRGEALHTLGHSERAAADFAVRWDTEWLPEQPEGFAVQARVRGADGKYRVGPPREGLRLAPRPYEVRVFAPDSVPLNWVTRSGAFEQSLTVDEVGDATAFRLQWVSWSPCYSNGVFLNGHLIWDRTDDCYVFATHEPTYRGAEVRYLQEGENVISTALTPLFRGQMVHGMEVQYPGMQLKIKYGGASGGEPMGH